MGTQLKDVLDFCGGLQGDVTEIIFGGPMMGPSQPDLETPLIKGTTGVVVLTSAESKPRHTYGCISCGRCLDACPLFLNPTALGQLAQAARFSLSSPRGLPSLARLPPAELIGATDAGKTS